MHVVGVGMLERQLRGTMRTTCRLTRVETVQFVGTAVAVATELVRPARSPSKFE